MKTPMQELIEEMERSPLMFAPALALIKEKNFLEKEEEVMCNFTADYTTLSEFQPLCSEVISIQDYYNETFKTKER